MVIFVIGNSVCAKELACSGTVKERSRLAVWIEIQGDLLDLDWC